MSSQTKDRTDVASLLAGPASTTCPISPRLAGLVAYLDGLQGRADLDVLARMLSGLEVSRADIAPACIFGERGYKRNTIRKTAWYELLALCWRSGDRTPIHDHAGVSCAFRIVEGDGTEIRFRQTPSGLICPTEAVEMRPGYVCAAADADIHQVANMQAPGTDLVTLHIYSPPIKKMNVYEFASPMPVECLGAYADVPQRDDGVGPIPC
jgi:cysteine dioxygenase